MSETVRTFTPERIPSGPPAEPVPAKDGDAPGAQTAQSSPLHSFLEHAAFFLFPFALALTVYLSLAHLWRLSLLWLVAAALPVGALVGDLVTGFVHWAADTYCDEETPVIGPSLIAPFRLHHIDPQDICHHGPVTTLGNTCVLAVPLLALGSALVWPESVGGARAFVVFTGAVVIAVTVATNQFHKWAHQESPRAFVRLLQRSRLILEPRHHDAHHTRPFKSNYSIANGWSNHALNRFQFFARLERALRRIGIKPSA